MSQIYKLYNAIALNATGKKEDVWASPIKAAEIRKHQHQFKFDFVSISKKFIVYKIYLGSQSDIIQGMVAFRHQKDYLDCVNMEINGFNKRGICLYSGVGKCLKKVSYTPENVGGGCMTGRVLSNAEAKDVSSIIGQYKEKKKASPSSRKLKS